MVGETEKTMKKVTRRVNLWIREMRGAVILCECGGHEKFVQNVIMKS